MSRDEGVLCWKQAMVLLGGGGVVAFSSCCFPSSCLFTFGAFVMLVFAFGIEFVNAASSLMPVGGVLVLAWHCCHFSYLSRVLSDLQAWSWSALTPYLFWCSSVLSHDLSTLSIAVFVCLTDAGCWRCR